MAKVRGVVFTINNWTAEDYQCVEALAAQAVYSIVGEEVGEKGTPHLQGYLYFANPRGLKALAKLMPRAHLEVAKGTAEQNRVYCSKGGKFTENGTMPHQGSRTDLDVMRDKLRQSPKMAEVVETAQSYQAVKMAEAWLKYHEAPRKWLMRVEWYYGPTGTGKTRAAFEAMPDAYWAMRSNKWWDGYDGHDDVIIDDIRCKFAEFDEMLGLLDRYPFKVEVKGSMRQFRARRVIITSPYHPRELYSTREDITQLLRRIHVIREYKEDGTIVVHKDATQEALTSDGGSSGEAAADVCS